MRGRKKKNVLRGIGYYLTFDDSECFVLRGNAYIPRIRCSYVI